MTHEWPEEVGTQTSWQTLESPSLTRRDAKNDDYLAQLTNGSSRIPCILSQAGKTNQCVVPSLP